MQTESLWDSPNCLVYKEPKKELRTEQKKYNSKRSSYLASVLELEEKVEQRVRQTASEGVLQVHLVALDHVLGVLAAPEQQHPVQVVLQHRDHRVGNVALFLGQGRVQILLVALAELLDDDGRVGDLLSVHLNERQLSLLGAQLQLVVNVLKRRRREQS